jgi:hypothetical protein
MNIVPTAAAIETAIKNAARDAKNYRLNDLNAEVGLWLVVHKTDETRKYLVDLNAGDCQCEQFKRAGVCKHQKMVDDEIEIRAMETMQEDGAFLLECSREHLAGFTEDCLSDTYGAWLS